MENIFRTSPHVRALTRAIVLGVFVYTATVLASGSEAFDLEPFLFGVGSTVIRVVIGYLTPLEPLIGITTKVEVPSPPAVADPEDDSRTFLSA